MQATDERVQRGLEEAGLAIMSHTGHLLYGPEDVRVHSAACWQLHELLLIR